MKRKIKVMRKNLHRAKRTLRKATHERGLKLFLRETVSNKSKEKELLPRRPIAAEATTELCV